jgi:hypothetical protein
MVIVSCHGAQLAFVGIFCGFARARLDKICAINRSLSVTPCSAQNRAISASVRMWFLTRTVKIRCSGGFR